MEIKVNFLDKLRLEAKFDDFTVVADQPIRYKGDGSAPGPFDYFLASSALCAAYFVKLYCVASAVFVSTHASPSHGTTLHVITNNDHAPSYPSCVLHTAS